jgi:hypothetical protein
MRVQEAWVGYFCPSVKSLGLVGTLKSWHPSDQI